MSFLRLTTFHLSFGLTGHARARARALYLSQCQQAGTCHWSILLLLPGSLRHFGWARGAVGQRPDSTDKLNFVHACSALCLRARIGAGATLLAPFLFCARVNCARWTIFIQIYPDVEMNWNDFCFKEVFVLFLYLYRPLAIVCKSRYIQFVIEAEIADLLSWK
jgi:hypothetical protein